jgi:hypothetical protein
MPKAKEQPEKRRYTIFRDQHGRKWEAVIEIQTGQPTGPVRPLFTAPYIPEPPFLRFSDREAGVMTINYDADANARKEAHRAWHQQMVRYAEGNYGQKSGEAIQNPTPEMIDYAGPRPAPVEFPLAAKAGNKWILGFVDAVPDWAVPLLPKKPQLVDAFPDADLSAFADEPSEPARRGRKVPT